MFRGFLRLVIFCTTMFIAWLATGRLLSVTHPEDVRWMGYVQATGIELMLAYCVWLVARTTEKGIVGLMILFFGLFSIGAQILHAYMFGIPLPNEEALPWILVQLWKYVLPSVPTLAGIGVGLLELAEAPVTGKPSGPGILQRARTAIGSAVSTPLPEMPRVPQPARSYAFEVASPTQAPPTTRRRKAKSSGVATENPLAP